MTLRTSAARYARALLDVALKESDPQKVETDLAAFVDVVNGHEDLGRVLISPRVPASTKRKLVEDVTARMSLEPRVAKLLALVAERGRMELLSELLAVYRERLLEHRGIVKGSVTSASPLTPDKVKALERRLSEATGKQVQLDQMVDASLIGGVVTRIGSTVYDGSIRTQLQRLRQQLVENA